MFRKILGIPLLQSFLDKHFSVWEIRKYQPAIMDKLRNQWWREPKLPARVICLHGKTWQEGSDFERFGGYACEKCCKLRRKNGK
jgi:hypothetical protein